MIHRRRKQSDTKQLQRREATNFRLLARSEPSLLDTEVEHTGVACTHVFLSGKTDILLTKLDCAHHDQVNISFVAERTDKLRVLGVVAVLGQAAQTGGPAVKCLGAPDVYRCQRWV